MKYIETIKIENGEFCNIEYHLRRMHRTIGKTYNLITEVPEEYQHGIVKYRVLYDENNIAEVTFSHYKQPKIETVKLIECNDIDYALKYADRSKINELMLHKGDCDDVLISRNGMITDTSFCNVIFQNDEGLFTPDTPLLKGTKRDYLLEKGIIKERRITIDVLQNYHNLILINAIMDDIKNVNIR